MWRRAIENTGTALLYLSLVLSHLGGEGSVVRVVGEPGRLVTLPCTYHHDDQTLVSQLSVQWRSPHNQLLCHYIKHKAFRNCTDGYTIGDTPGNITLTILRTKMEDFGSHVCSISRRHDFSDHTIELVPMADDVTSAPKSGWSHSGSGWRLALLRTLTLLVCL